jgi:hypothetical protein
MKKKIENEAMKLYNEAAKLGLNSSYRSILDCMYEIASEKKQYEKGSIIIELIADDINADY